MAELLREEEAPLFLYPPTTHTGAKKAHALESSPRLGGLQSLQPRTGVLAVEGLESLAWRTGNALYCRHTCIFHQKHLSLNFQNLKKKQAWQIPSCPG